MHYYKAPTLLSCLSGLRGCWTHYQYRPNKFHLSFSRIVRAYFPMAKKSTTKKRIVLLDTHAIIHRAYHALPEFTGPTGAPTGALYGIVAMLLKIITDLKPDYIAAC